MAGELQIRHTTGATGVYAMVFDATGSVWATDSSAFETYATVDITDYDIAFGELGTASQIFTATFPSAIAAGDYHIIVKDGSGTAAEADTYVTDYWVQWSGSVLLPRAAWALVDADPVAASRTWTALHDRSICREIVEVLTTDTAVYSMFFGARGVLNPDTSLLTADSVSDTSGNALVTSGLTLSQDKMSVHFTVTGSDLAAATEYTLKVTATSTDGVTLARIGKLTSL